jgi:hypothetical protein
MACQAQKKSSDEATSFNKEGACGAPFLCGEILIAPRLREVNMRVVRSIEVSPGDATSVANGIQDLYDDEIDVIVARGAFAPEPLAAAGERLDTDKRDPGWARPNQRMPAEDIQLLGTDTPATPTFQNPRGASLAEYLESAARHQGSSQVFEGDFDPQHEIERALERFSGGRPVAIAAASDGRQYVPFTIRRLVNGKQIGIHHDYHYPLSLYGDHAPRLDTGTLVSFVATMRQPDRGGDLVVYGVTPTTPDAPKLPNGFSWDLEAIEQRYHSARFTLGPGDLFLLASGRCLHRVDRIEGPRARVTMGGFLALDKDRRRVLYWS